MEDSWQIKCSSTLQCLTSSMASPSSSHELQNQADRKVGCYPYPHDPHDLRQKVLGAVQGPVFPNHPNLSSSQKPTHVSLGNSFLALLSGPLSLLQCDFKELSNSKLLSDSSSVIVNSFGGAMPSTLNDLPTEYLSKQNLPLGPDFCSSISTRTVAGSNCSTDSVFPGLQTTELEPTFNHRLVSGNEKPKCSFSFSGEWHAAIPSNSSKVSSTKVQTSEMKSVDQNSSVSNFSSSFLSNCPRVFCLGTGGYLLISNTGVLGIVCSCHNLQMSVSKFCEHSGLCGGNAGDLVRMESGETIAMWRKLYFLKLGIRISEEQSGWDWPEGLTATSSLGLKSKTSFPNNSLNISRLAHSSEGILRPGQVSDSTMLSNLHTFQNSVIDASQSKQNRNTLDNVSRENLIGPSQRNMHILANTQILEHPLSGFSTVSKSLSISPQVDYRSPIYTDTILKNGDSCVVRPAVQDLRTTVQKPDFNMSKSAPSGVFIGSDVTFSNIELKLGQPHQSNQNSKESDRPALGTRLLDTFVNPSKSLFTQQMLHNATGCRNKVEVGQYFHCAADPCKSNNKSEQSQLNLGNRGFEFYNANIAATPSPGTYGGNLDHNTVVSPISNFNVSTGNSVQINCNINMLSSTKRSVPHPQHCEPRFTTCDPSPGSWTYGNGSERQYLSTEMGPHGLTGQSKVVKFASNGPFFMKEYGSRTHKETETSTSHPFSSAAQESNSTLHLSSAPLETYDVKRLPSSHVNIPSFENNLQVNHITHRSLTSNFGSRQILPSEVIMKGIPLASSTCLPDQTPALHGEEGIGHRPHLLDDNFRILALRQIMELSKQQCSFSSIGINRWEGRCDGNSHFHHAVAESLAPVDQCNSHGFTGNREANEAAVRAYLAGATNTSACCDLPTLIRGIPIHSKDIDVQGQISGDPLRNEQLPMSRSRKDIPGTPVHEKCCRVPTACIQHNCNCSVYRNCTERNLESNGDSFPHAFMEQRGKVNGEPSATFGSKFPQNHICSNSEIPSTEQETLSNHNLSKNIVGHASQWRDVPSKVKGISTDVCRDTSAECINSTGKIMPSYTEHANSNISSGSSAPAVTQLSVEISNMDSSGADAANTGSVSNLVVDEGSAIYKSWSSDDAHVSERSAEFHQDICKTSSTDSGSSLNANRQSSRSLLDELKLMNSLTWKTVQKQIQTEMPDPKDNLYKKYHEGLRKERKIVCSSVVHCEKYEEINSADSPRSATESMQMISLPKPNGSEHKLSVSSSLKKPIRKRDLCKIYNDKEGKDDCQTELKASGGNRKIPEVAAGKKLKRGSAGAVGQSLIGGQTRGGSRTMRKRNFEGCLKSSFGSLTNYYSSRPRPVAWGKYGELSTGEFGGDMEKSSKIVPLSRVLKSAKRCELSTNGKPVVSSMGKLSRTDTNGIKESYDESHHLKIEEGNSSHSAEVSKTNTETSLEMKNGFSGRDYKLAGNLHASEVNKHHRNKKDCGKEDSIANGRLKSKTKEIRKRSIYELTVDVIDVCSASRECTRTKSSLPAIEKCFPEVIEGKILRNGDDMKHELCKGDAKPQEKTISSLLDLDSFCCVCAGSNKDELNYLLQCNKCLIRVHQACYGVSKVPKGHWYCRPCRTGSMNTVCVLCGYGGGAMTRALQSRTVVESLLKVWNFETEGNPKNVLLPVQTLEKSLSRWDFSDSGCESGSLFPVLQPENMEPFASSVGKLDFPNHLYVSQNSPRVTKIKVDNNITAGLLNSATKQWVHMVCGLWTPGTRCPNVNTMSAFDVSGVLCPKADVACSICSRPGGTCVKCRILNCSVHFHPWCAHQKGLLQSEVEGVDNESVGFYGRCLLHATDPMCESDPGPADRVTGCSGTDELTCARTEGYKGRKHDGFFHNNHPKRKVGCYVPQEQLNAWIHINGQKSGIQGLPKLPVSDVEHDCRKEYARYKQGKGWKHLVVYKSGIHALGLYTSRFISRGEMVVEYVGEIVGLRVSDKRENEYQSGRKLQYKSACYFFRIDKEHIIDAARKGGIARFVNHSCSPNCVAKVITIRNDKKVVFFAEKDIFPGEEITYDYHFNHEDEGKKIPCFCNSKNCRRYLN